MINDIHLFGKGKSSSGSKPSTPKAASKPSTPKAASKPSTPKADSKKDAKADNAKADGKKDAKADNISDSFPSASSAAMPDTSIVSMPSFSSSGGGDGGLTEEMVERIVRKDITMALNPMAMFQKFKGALENLLNADSLRSMYDLITSDPSLGDAFKAVAGSHFSTIDTIIHILLPSREVVYIGVLVTLAIMIFGQSVLIFELLRIISLCNNNTNLTTFIRSVKVCLFLSIIMIGFEFFIFMYMVRTKHTFARHKMRYFYNWIAIFQFGQFGLISAVSLLWVVVKGGSAFKASVINTPNVIPNLANSVLFAFSTNTLMSLLIFVSWAYFCGLDSLILPILHEATSQLGL